MYRRILVPVDGSPTSNKALVAALQMARDGGGRVRLLHVLDVLSYLTGFEYGGDLPRLAREYATKVLDDARAVARSAGVEAETQLADVPGERLGRLVAEDARHWDADLVVLGTHGRRGLGRVLLGSGAEQIIRESPVPVLVIRSEEEARGA